MKFFSLHAFQLRQQKPWHQYTELFLGLGASDPFIPLSFPRLWTVQTTDATITLLSQLIPFTAVVELPKVPPTCLQEQAHCPID